MPPAVADQEPQRPVDPIYTLLVQKLMNFYDTEIPADDTGITLKHHAEVGARDIMMTALNMVEEYASKKSAIAKYDLLKWIGNKKTEVRFYK